MQRQYFYSHTPHGVQPNSFAIFFINFSFLLTHPSRGATTTNDITGNAWRFLLTHPSRGATSVTAGATIEVTISTHTPLAGCNGILADILELTENFYSHTPCGVQRCKKPFAK